LGADGEAFVSVVGAANGAMSTGACLSDAHERAQSVIETLGGTPQLKAAAKADEEPMAPMAPAGLENAARGGLQAAFQDVAGWTIRMT